MRGDSNYAWPSAEVAVMGAKGAVSIIFRDPKARVRNIIFRKKMITKITLNPKFFVNRFSHSNFIQEYE